MSDKVYTVIQVENRGKFDKFWLDDGWVLVGDSGRLERVLSVIQHRFGERPKPPFKVRRSDASDRYFHVDKIFYCGLWVGVKKSKREKVKSKSILNM